MEPRHPCFIPRFSESCSILYTLEIAILYKQEALLIPVSPQPAPDGVRAWFLDSHRTSASICLVPWLLRQQLLLRKVGIQLT